MDQLIQSDILNLVSFSFGNGVREAFNLNLLISIRNEKEKVELIFVDGKRVTWTLNSEEDAKLYYEDIVMFLSQSGKYEKESTSDNKSSDSTNFMHNNTNYMPQSSVITRSFDI